MTKAMLIHMYKDFLRAFDLKPDDVLVDKTCMDVLAGKTCEVEKLSVLLHPPTHRFVLQIMEHEVNNMSAIWAFLGYLDPHLLVGEVERVTIDGVVGTTTSFISATTSRTLH